MRFKNLAVISNPFIKGYIIFQIKSLQKITSVQRQIIPVFQKKVCVNSQGEGGIDLNDIPGFFYQEIFSEILTDDIKGISKV